MKWFRDKSKDKWEAIKKEAIRKLITKQAELRAKEWLEEKHRQEVK